jgi:serine/threonine protein kinase
MTPPPYRPSENDNSDDDPDNPSSDPGWSSTQERWRPSTAAKSSRSIPRSARVRAFSADLESAVAEFHERWERGELPRVETYQNRLDNDQLIELIYIEYCMRLQAGESPELAEYAERFPDLAERLSRVLDLHEVIGSSNHADLWEFSPEAKLPEVGDEVGPYRLIRLLGSGGLARVFLAEQADLADRLVVIKIADRPSAEPRLLARARHPNIVEVLRHGTAEQGKLHLICMPFLGGAPLSEILDELKNSPKRFARRVDRRPIPPLDRRSAPEFPADDRPRPTRDLLSKLTSDQAWAWIVARIAEALDFAYRRGVTHGDVKPSNILFAADGTPMLFDFNLAIEWSVDGFSETIGANGGTLAYMSPERLRAVADPVRAKIPLAAERHRADLYATGLVLLECLTGVAPEVPERGSMNPREMAARLAALRETIDPLESPSCRSIPAGLRSITARLIAPNPADRYARAIELRDDLDAWLAGRPLVHAVEPAGFSTAARLVRRHRTAISAAGLVVAGIILASSVIININRNIERKQARALSESLWEHADPGVFRFRQIGHWRVDSPFGPAETARRHLERFHVLESSDWRDRNDVRSLPEIDRLDLEAWICEQAWRYARELADRPKSPEDWRRAHTCLSHVYSLTPLGPLRSLADHLAKRLGIEAVERSADRSRDIAWMEHYLRGVEAESASWNDALGEYKKALAARPDSFWAHYRAAAAYHWLGRPAAAAELLRYCAHKQPRNPAIRTQLAGCLFQSNNYESALAECEAAIAISPDFVEAYKTRIHVNEKLGRHDRALEDLKRYELATTHQGRIPAWRAELDAAPPDDPNRSIKNDDQIDILRSLIAFDPDDVDSRINLASKLFRRGDDQGALDQFNDVLRRKSNNPRAKYGRAMIALRQNRVFDAKRDLEDAIDDPSFVELIRQEHEFTRAFHHLIRIYISLGFVDQAIELSEKAVKASDDLEYLRGESHYALARCYAVAAVSKPEYLVASAKELETALSYHSNYVEISFKNDPLVADEVKRKVISMLGR